MHDYQQGLDRGQPLSARILHSKTLHLVRAPLAFLRMRRANVRELLENVSVRLEAGGGNIAFGEEGEAMLDDVVSKNATIWILSGLRRSEAQHVGQNAVCIDSSDCFFAGVIARMPHQVNKLLRPALAIVDRLAGVVFQFGVVGIEEAADAWVTSAINMKQLAVLVHATPSPDPDLWVRAELACRQLDHYREHISFRI